MGKGGVVLVRVICIECGGPINTWLGCEHYPTERKTEESIAEDEQRQRERNANRLREQAGQQRLEGL
jgi:hypothetical protein